MSKEGQVKKKLVRWNIDLVRDYINENTQFTLLSDTYKNNLTKLDFICSCGESYSNNFGKITSRNITKCKKCSGTYVETYEEMKVNIENSNGCILLDSKDTFKRKELNIKCKCGEDFKQSYNYFMSKPIEKRACQKCTGYKPQDIDTITEFLKGEEGNGCKLLSTEYISVKEELEFQCKCGNSFKTTLNNFTSQNKRHCDECGLKNRAEKRKYTYEEVKSYIEENSDCILLSKEYTGVFDYMLFKCGCGRDFETTLSSFKSAKKRHCDECGILNGKYHRNEISDVRHFVEVESKSGCKLISDDYINNHTEMTFKCKCGEIFVTTYGRFTHLGKRHCDTCGKINQSNGKKLGIDFVRKFVRENSSCKLISTTYKTIKDDMEFKCACGERFVTKFDTFKTKDKRQCNKCSGTENIYYDDVLKYVEDNSNCELISTKYTYSTDKLDFKCECGRLFSTSYTQFRARKKKTCLVCSNDVFDFRYVKEYTEKHGRGTVLLSNSYNPNENLRFRCSCNNEFEKSFSNFKLSPSKQCERCRSSEGEIRILNYLTSKQIELETEYEFDGLIGLGGGNLRYDFAIFDKNENLVMLCEFDGIFHFKQIFSEQKFKTQQEHDRRKNIFCENNNIPLLRIPYWDMENIEQILEKELIRYSLL